MEAKLISIMEMHQILRVKRRSLKQKRRLKSKTCHALALIRHL
jgi:hypothetical protein